MAKLVIKLDDKVSAATLKAAAEAQNLEEEVGIFLDSPEQATISGHRDYMLRLQRALKEKGISAEYTSGF